MLITIDQNGLLETIARDELADLFNEGRTEKRRASHVAPSYWSVRAAFYLLRWATGEVGMISDYTRRWPAWLTGGWRVQIVNGPSLGWYCQRADAIAAEVEWIEANQLS